MEFGGMSGGTTLNLEINGTPNGSQTLLNLVAGTNITLTDNGVGSITIAASGGGGGSGTVTSVGSSDASITVTNPTTTPNLIVATAPAGALTGTTLKSTVVTSSLTSVGTIATGIWNGTAIGASYIGDLSATYATVASLANTKITSVGFTIPNSASAVIGKVAGFFTCPYAGTITGWNIVTDAGTVTVTVWKIATGTAHPTVANSISTGGVALSSGTAVHSSTTSDFTSTTVTANDIFAFNISAISGVGEMTFNLEITKT